MDLPALPSPRPATDADWPEVRDLLASRGLPVDGAREHLAGFAVARDPVDGALAGCAGLEVHGDAALLRSVAVAPGWQGRGLGERLVRDRLDAARRRGLRSVHLLTTTAPGWFPRFGFVEAPATEAPPALRASAEFQGACPASARHFARPLDDGPTRTPAGSAQRLNAGCFCTGLDEDALHREVRRQAGDEVLALLQARCPHVFAARPVFVSEARAAQVAEVVAAVESVLALPAFQDEVLARSPAIARHGPVGARGVFMGYDFHVTDGGVGLIEINTNAGGAMLNALLARAQAACCEPVRAWLASMTARSTADAFEAGILAMVESEWTRSGRRAPLRTIAIVDERPAEQYLYPEFLLFQRLFEARGWQVVIADPADLAFEAGRLRARVGERAMDVDLVYNRLTDFALEADASAALRAAWLADAVVLTPHPRAHALHADKRNLALLSDPAWLARAGVPAATRAVLEAAVPRTELVDPAHAERLWADRRRLFFKPFAGYGGRAAWRGDKLTRRVWDEVLAGGYVAQALVPPGERAVDVDRSPDAAPASMKFDLRAYAYDGRVQWLAARIYQGQTTNFRTPGGGFAPVWIVPDADAAALAPGDAPGTSACCPTHPE